MQINPGGRLDTKDIIGRDNEIERYWSVLQRQGLVLSAERRIGKTHILLKMREECQSGYLPFYQDLEAVHSIADLIRSIHETARQSSSTRPSVKTHIAKWSALLPNKIAGVELPTADASWQVLLTEAFDHLINIADDGMRVLMLWDEFPLMLHNLQRKAGQDAPIQLLDHLRALRLARADRLRFLFTGSLARTIHGDRDLAPGRRHRNRTRSRTTGNEQWAAAGTSQPRVAGWLSAEWT